MLACYMFTSVFVSSEVKSVWVLNEIVRSGFLSSVAKLAHRNGDYPIETLASIVFTTRQYARMWEI